MMDDLVKNFGSVLAQLKDEHTKLAAELKRRQQHLNVLALAICDLEKLNASMNGSTGSEDGRPRPQNAVLQYLAKGPSTQKDIVNAVADAINTRMRDRRRAVTQAINTLRFNGRIAMDSERRYYLVDKDKELPPPIAGEWREVHE